MKLQFGPPPECPVIDTDPPPTLPGQQCRLYNGTCQYTEFILECYSTIVSYTPYCEKASPDVIDRSIPSNDQQPNYIPPDNLCLPINSSCQWFNPCRAWKDNCLGTYQCGTLDQYYRFIYGPTPTCSLPSKGWAEPLPPGECVINAKGECGWSSKSQ